MSIDSTHGSRARLARSARLVAVVAIAAVPLAACKTNGGGMFSGVSKTTQHGYVIPEMALEQIPPGSSRDQVLIALGTPSTTATFGGEVFYYISQTKYQAIAFLEPKVVDQRVVAVYFTKDSKVERVANYGLKDGKVFDFVRGVTPTGGQDQTFLQSILSGAVGFGKVPVGAGGQ
jgi:outer membrane protein assembly factor BamE (lipoprotein component of BamABCDE complex)